MVEYLSNEVDDAICFLRWNVEFVSFQFKDELSDGFIFYIFFITLTLFGV